MMRWPGRETRGRIDGSTASGTPGAAGHDADELLQYQRTVGNQSVARRATGKVLAGVEALSGVAMDDVRVRHDSDVPGRVGARAFTSGTEIHLGHGEEDLLGHEAWHVVQQKQGRVPASTTVAGVGVNLDSSLEREADTMGARARTAVSALDRLPTPERAAESRSALGRPAAGPAPVRQFKTGSRGVRRETGRTYDHPIFSDTEAHLATRGELAPLDFPIYDSKGQKTVIEESHVREWVVQDGAMSFYTARNRGTARSILDNGLDPTRGGVEVPISTSQDLSRGHIYFARDMQIPKRYGGMNLDSDFVILEFTLPTGTIAKGDPEIPGAMRTTAFVTADRILRVYDRRCNPLDPTTL